MPHERFSDPLLALRGEHLGREAVRVLRCAPEEPPEYPETFFSQERVSECCGAPFVSDTDFCSRCHDHAGNAVPVCAECGQERPDDDRVLAGMKCGPCAYGC